jgi:bacteriocin-like protein
MKKLNLKEMSKVKGGTRNPQTGKEITIPAKRTNP